MQPQPPEYAQDSKTKAKVILKRTNTRTMTTESTEHWLSKWVKDDVLEIYNTVPSRRHNQSPPVIHPQRPSQKDT